MINPIAKKLIERPILFAQYLGFEVTPFSETHNEWLKNLIAPKDYRLCAYRGSYKSTMIMVAICLQILLRPQVRILLARKTATLSKATFKNIVKIVQGEKFAKMYKAIWGIDNYISEVNSETLRLTLKDDTNPVNTLRFSSVGRSETGNRYDCIYSDDISDNSDRFSEAERVATFEYFSELTNLRQRQDAHHARGAIYLTGTRWHRDDVFKPFEEDGSLNVIPATESITESMNPDILAKLKKELPLDLFLANYMLQITTSSEQPFNDIQFGSVQHIDTNIEKVEAYIDPAYKSSKLADFSALVCGVKMGGKFYIIDAELWRTDIDKLMAKIVRFYERNNVRVLHLEDNADKGLLKKMLQTKRLSDGRQMRFNSVTNKVNKFMRIEEIIPRWNDVIFNELLIEKERRLKETLDKTHDTFLQQLAEFILDAKLEKSQHDDAPDALCGLLKKLGLHRPTSRIKTVTHEAFFS